MKKREVLIIGICLGLILALVIVSETQQLVAENGPKLETGRKEVRKMNPWLKTGLYVLGAIVVGVVAEFLFTYAWGGFALVGAYATIVALRPWENRPVRIMRPEPSATTVEGKPKQ